MKKKLLFLTLIFSFLIFDNNAFASEYVVSDQDNVCTYKVDDKVLTVQYSGLGSILYLGYVKYYISNNIENPIFFYDTYQASDRYINWQFPINDLIMEDEIYSASQLIANKIGDATLNDSDVLNSGKGICPETMYIYKYKLSADETIYDLYACGVNEYNNNTCSVTKEYLNNLSQKANYDNSNGEIITLDYYASNMITGDEDEELNVQESYDELMEAKEKYCDKDYIAKNGREDCDKILILIADSTSEGGQYENLGYDIGDLYENFLNRFNLPFETGKCESYLGEISNHNSPAYLLNYVFNIIKYVSIVLLFIFTFIEVFKAIVDGKDESRKKIIEKFIKRFLFATIIFFLPLLINFVLSVLGVITMDDACNVGAAPSNGMKEVKD